MTEAVYEPYVSKSDRPKGRAKLLKKSPFVWDKIAANDLLTNGKRPPIPTRVLNQQQKRKRARQ